MSSSHPSPWVQGAKEVERVQDPKGMYETKLKMFSRHNRTDADMNSESVATFTRNAQVQASWGPSAESGFRVGKGM